MAHRILRDEPDENHDRWLVSYADFITLLFAFFVTMYAISSVNEGKYRVLSDSLVQAFRSVTVNTAGAEVMVRANAPSVPRTVSLRRQAAAEEQKRVARDKMQSVARDIAEVMSPLVREGRVRVTETAKGVTVEINASVLFSPGDARLDPAAAQALRAVAGILSRTDFPVTVEGHTDITPIETQQFPSNWELSVVRASSVVRLFVDAGVAPQNLTATGYGEQRPVAGNDTAEGRARNRRVTILIESPSREVPRELPVEPKSGAGAAGTRSAQRPSLD
jgi:chemotaxis protein MotB